MLDIIRKVNKIQIMILNSYINLNFYTITQSDARYYTQTQSDTKQHSKTYVISNQYTIPQSDAR